MVVFSGVSDGKLPAIRELVRTGIMTTNRITSATFNPAVVNSFAENFSDEEEGTYVLEILTDRVCPTASVITGQGGAEGETLIPAGTTLELVNTLHDVEYLWHRDEQGRGFGRTHKNVLQVRVKDQETS